MTTNTEKIAALQGSMEDVERSQEEIEANLRDVRDQQEGLSNVLAELKGQHEDHMAAMDQRFTALETSIRDLTGQLSDANATASAVAKESREGRYRSAGTYTISEKIKVWQRTMVLNKVSYKGHYNFPAARQDYIRLHKRFSLPQEMELEMIMLAFEKSALTVANEVVRNNTELSIQAIWDELENCLYNESQKRTQNAAFLQMAWNERKDTVCQFAEKVNSSGLALKINPDLIRATFIRGLPVRLQTYAYGIHGTYDDLVGSIANIANTMNRSQKTSELVREVKEPIAEPQGASDDKAKETSVGAYKPRLPYEDWKKTAICRVCGEMGHLAREKSLCSGRRKEDADVKVKGNNRPGNRAGSVPHNI